MPVAVALLVVVSALVHALWNALLKRTRDPEHAVVGVTTVAALSACALALALRVQVPPRVSLAWCVASGVLEAGYFVTLARALARAPLGPVYTVVRGGALVVVWPLSLVFLGETLTAARASGTLLVVLGLAATGASEHRSAPSTQTSRAGLGIAAACAMFVGGYHLAYKLALQTGGRAEAVVAIALSTASIVNIAALGKKGRARVFEAVRASPALIAGGGLLATMGFVLFLLAMSRAGAGVVLTLRNTSILFAQALALTLGDRLRALGIAGAALVTAGAVLLTL